MRRGVLDGILAPVMTDRPPDAPPDSPAAGSAGEPTRFLFVWAQGARHILHQHPALALTLGYLFLSLVGMVYEESFFSQFDLQILDFADPSDFILVSLRKPALLGITLFSLWVMLRMVRRHARRMDRSPRYRRLAEWIARRPWWPLAARFVYAALLVGYFLALTASYAEHNADVIKKGRGPKVRVEVVADAAAKSGPPGDRLYTLLGTTSRYLLLYDSAAGRTEVLPVNNLARLTAAR